MLRGTDEYVRNAEARLVRARESGDVAEMWLVASALAVMERRRASVAAHPAAPYRKRWCGSRAAVAPKPPVNHRAESSN